MAHVGFLISSQDSMGMSGMPQAMGTDKTNNTDHRTKQFNRMPIALHHLNITVQKSKKLQ